MYQSNCPASDNASYVGRTGTSLGALRSSQPSRTEVIALRLSVVTGPSRKAWTAPTISETRARMGASARARAYTHAQASHCPYQEGSVSETYADIPLGPGAGARG